MLDLQYIQPEPGIAEPQQTQWCTLYTISVVLRACGTCFAAGRWPQRLLSVQTSFAGASLWRQQRAGTVLKGGLEEAGREELEVNPKH